MNSDEQTELKQKINNFIWECAPGDMTLVAAEELAISIFNTFEKTGKGWSPPEEAG